MHRIIRCRCRCSPPLKPNARSFLTCDRSARFTSAAKAHISMICVGTVGEDAPLFVDGFMGRNELRALVKAGALGGGLLNGLITDETTANAVLA